MLLKRWYDEKLAAATYLIGCHATGTSLVVDPLRVVEGYVDDARREGLRVTHVTETHIHADFASGSRDLAARTGARLLLSGEGGEDWRYQDTERLGATLLRDGDSFMVGNIRIDVLHTPGHTPEHLTFQVTDTAGADRPMGVCTGDFLFVGDVGRPDLLETAAGVEGTMRESARRLFRSLERFRAMPDYLQIWPGHGAGSACGKALGAVPQSTVGYEKQFNWAFRHEDEEGFVEAVLEGQPEPPRYFAVMKRMNRDGVPPLPPLERPRRLDADELAAILAAGEMVADLRGTRAFAAAHIPGTINLPMGRSFPTYAGSFIDYDLPLHLIGDEGRVDAALPDLARIGFDQVAGWSPPEVVERSPARASSEDMEPEEAARRLRDGSIELIDVRQPSEWEDGHIPGVRRIPFGHVADRAGELDGDRPMVLYCQTGSRSAVEASVLRARGIEGAMNLVGGIDAWRRAGHPVEPEAAGVAG